MPSRPFARLRRACPATLPRRASAALAAAVTGALLLTAACSRAETAETAGQAAPAAQAATRGAPTRLAAYDLSWTTTMEIRFDGELVGYLVEVNPVPEGIVDSRPWEPGTAIIEDKDFQPIGFISPRGTTYRFDEDNKAKPVGFGSRDSGIAAFFRRNGKPQIVAPHIGG